MKKKNTMFEIGKAKNVQNENIVSEINHRGITINQIENKNE